MRLRIGRSVVALVIAMALVPTSLSAQAVPSSRPTNQELTTVRAADKDWITYGGSLFNQRFSTLNQINTSNVDQLKGAWMTRLGSGRGSKYKFEADPLVIDGVMYIPTGNDDIFALDAKTGRKIWEYFSDIPQVNDTICCGWNNRGVAAGQGMIFSGQLDGSFVALDQKTGRIAWRTQLEDYKDGYSITGATRYFDGLVFTGISGGEYGIRGRVYALDAATGREIWRFYTVPGPGEIGSETWPMNDPDPLIRDIYLRGGATVWQAPAIDPELGMLYFTTGNASPREGSLRPGDNLFTASFVALDYKTGKYRWHFQQVKHELWDYDLPNPPVLFDQMYNGQMRKGIYQASKTGWLYFLDRTNGQPLIGMEYKPIPPDPYPGASEKQNASPVQPYPVGDSYMNQCPEPLPQFPFIADKAGCIFTSYWDVPILLRPSNGGGTNFSPTSYHPPTGYVFVNASEANQATAADLLSPREFEVGRSYRRQFHPPVIGSSVTSTMTAMDSRTNKIVWQKREQGENGYGWASTAGDIVFAGHVDGNLSAYNVRTGEELWKFQTGWGISAPPMTYMLDGVQYVAVASGGNRGGNVTLDGDAVWAFTLNGVIDQLPSPPPIQTKVNPPAANVRLGGEVGLNPPTTTAGGTWTFDGTFRTLDFRFEPQGVTVPKGTTLSWENLGSTVHTASETKGVWDTGEFASGEVKSIAFDTPGTYDYICKPHPWMIGRIVITE
jgi:quinohemoprotein ethanol dehydrogenase